MEKEKIKKPNNKTFKKNSWWKFFLITVPLFWAMALLLIFLIFFVVRIFVFIF